MKTWLRRLLILGFVLTAVVLVLLEALRWTAAERGVVEVPLPAGSEIAARSKGADYADAYRAPLGRPGVTGAAIGAVGFRQGREIARTANEVVFEGSAPGLRFLASYFLERGPTAGHVTLSTSVFYHSVLGRIYFTPVRIGHRRLVPFATYRIAEHLPPEDE